MKKTPIRYNIKKVINALRNGKKKYSELAELGIPEKTLTRILINHLDFWGLAHKDDNGFWVWYEYTQVLSPYQHKKKIEHSKKLIQRLDTSPYLMIDLLAFASEKEDFEVFNLLQHIKTAYKETYSLIENYKKKMIATGLDHYVGYPKPILSHEFPSPTFEGHMPVKVSARLEIPNIETLMAEQTQKEEMQKWDNDPKIKDLTNLRDVLVGKLIFLKYQVKHGKPLDGVCNLCPQRSVTIKEENLKSVFKR